MKPDPQEKLSVLRAELSKFNHYNDVIDHFLLRMCNDAIIKANYPTLAVLMFDKNNSILDEDKFAGSFVVDYRIQWTSSENTDEDGYGTLADFDNIHYLQLHLYLYFKSSRPHIPATLGKFDFAAFKDTEDLLSRIREFTFQLGDMVQDNEYLGHAVAYNDVM